MSGAPKQSKMGRGLEVADIKTDLGDDTILYLGQRVNGLETLVQNIVPGLGEQQNTYKLLKKDSGGKPRIVYEITESSNLCLRCFCNPQHPMDLYVDTPEKVPRFSFQKPFRCFKCFNCGPCCLAKMYALDENDMVIASAHERCVVCFKPIIDIYDGDGYYLDSVSGPSGVFDGICFQDTNIAFKSSTHNKANVLVKINKFTGDEKAMFDESSKGGEGMFENSPFLRNQGIQKFLTDADYYKVQFPNGISIEEKVGLLASALLLEYMFFERDESNFQDGLVLCKCYCLGCNETCRVGGQKSRNREN